MDFNNQDRIKLIHFLDFVCDYEASKKPEEMDEELINSCVKVLLDLQDKHLELSPEFINNQVRKIFHKEENKTTAPETVKTTKKVINQKKVWLVAACIAILVALFSIVSFSSERTVVDVLEDFFGSYDIIPWGKEIDVDNESYGKSNSVKVYKSIKDFAKKEKIDFLCPTNDVALVEHVSIGETDKKTEINITFNDTDLSITIKLDSDIPEEILEVCNDEVTINGIEYYLCIMEDVNQAQAYLVYNNNMYRIIHTDKSSLIEILNNMEEIKYEN